MKDKKSILDNPHLKENPFNVPEDYFDTNAIKIIAKIHSTSTETFNVPEDYFETNALKLQEKLLSNSFENVFTYPEGYFEDTEKKLFKEIQSLKPQKRRIIPLIRTIGIAASVTLFILTTYILLQPKPNSHSEITKNKDCQTLACLTKKDISKDIEYLDEADIEEAVSEQDIEKHFNSKNYPSPSPTNSNIVNETF
ncbi:MAG: hypothetical protein N3F62_07505 [Bacteroidia bacterium]|nr:hypothetical protein [Bacteroidia bacterium]